MTRTRTELTEDLAMEMTEIFLKKARLLQSEGLYRTSDHELQELIMQVIVDTDLVLSGIAPIERWREE